MSRKVTCWGCGKPYAVTTRGTIWVHWLKSPTRQCEGSGRPAPKPLCDPTEDHDHPSACANGEAPRELPPNVLFYPLQPRQQLTVDPKVVIADPAAMPCGGTFTLIVDHENVLQVVCNGTAREVAQQLADALAKWASEQHKETHG